MTIQSLTSELPKRRRWLQFSLRSLLIVMLLCGCGLGWLANARLQVKQQQDFLQAIEDGGGSVWKAPGELTLTSQGELSFVESWQERLGIKIAIVPGISIMRLESSHNRSLLAKFPDLYMLGVASPANFTDADLSHLSGMTKLVYLELIDSQITDLGLVHLSNLTELDGLVLSGTKITDAGLVHLTSLKKLKQLRVDRTSVTDEGKDRLRQLLPEIDID